MQLLILLDSTSALGLLRGIVLMRDDLKNMRKSTKCTSTD